MVAVAAVCFVLGSLLFPLTLVGSDSGNLATRFAMGMQVDVRMGVGTMPRQVVPYVHAAAGLEDWVAIDTASPTFHWAAASPPPAAATAMGTLPVAPPFLSVVQVGYTLRIKRARTGRCLGASVPAVLGGEPVHHFAFYINACTC